MTQISKSLIWDGLCLFVTVSFSCLAASASELHQSMPAVLVPPSKTNFLQHRFSDLSVKGQDIVLNLRKKSNPYEMVDDTQDDLALKVTVDGRLMLPSSGKILDPTNANIYADGDEKLRPTDFAAGDVPTLKTRLELRTQEPLRTPAADNVTIKTNATSLQNDTDIDIDKWKKKKKVKILILDDGESIPDALKQAQQEAERIFDKVTPTVVQPKPIKTTPWHPKTTPTPKTIRIIHILQPGFSPLLPPHSQSNDVHNSFLEEESLRMPLYAQPKGPLFTDIDLLTRLLRRQKERKDSHLKHAAFANGSPATNEVHYHFHFPSGAEYSNEQRTWHHHGLARHPSRESADKNYDEVTSESAVLGSLLPLLRRSSQTLRDAGRKISLLDMLKVRKDEDNEMQGWSLQGADSNLLQSIQRKSVLSDENATT